MSDQDIERILIALKEVSDKTNKIYTGLYGIPETDEKGMCGEFHDLRDDYYKFKTRAMVIFFFLLGTGVLGTAIYQIIQNL